MCGRSFRVRRLLGVRGRLLGGPVHAEDKGIQLIAHAGRPHQCFCLGHGFRQWNFNLWIVEITIFLAGQLGGLGGADLQRLLQPIDDVGIFELVAATDRIDGFFESIRPSAHSV